MEDPRKSNETKRDRKSRPFVLIGQVNRLDRGHLLKHLILHNVNHKFLKEVKDLPNFQRKHVHVLQLWVAHSSERVV